MLGKCRWWWWSEQPPGLRLSGQTGESDPELGVGAGLFFLSSLCAIQGKNQPRSSSLTGESDAV